MQTCRICSSHNLSYVIDLGLQPWGNHFLNRDEVGKEPFYPLRLLYCHACTLAQLDYTVRKEIMFSDHTYLSGITALLSSHFRNVAEEVDQRFCQKRSKKSVLDIGSNDGTQLAHYQQLGFEVMGVESSKRVAAIANKRGIKTAHAFFNLDFATKLNCEFDIINASGVFFHLEELHSVTQAIKRLLKKDGVFVVQFLYMKSIQANCAFDQIYHEHLVYYTLKTIGAILEQHGLALFDGYLSPIHGGSIIGFAGHAAERQCSQRLNQLYEEENLSGCNHYEEYLLLAKKISQLKTQNIDFLNKKKLEGKCIFGLGAPVKGNTLLNYFGIGLQFLDFLVERNPLRKGLYSPGKHIPIILENEIDKQPDIYYVLAWNFKDEILKRNAHLIEQGVEFYFPINPRS